MRVWVIKRKMCKVPKKRRRLVHSLVKARPVMGFRVSEFVRVVAVANGKR